MKRYVSHKEVDAGRIVAVVALNHDTMQHRIVLEDKSEFKVTHEWYLKHSDNDTKELEGGYYVVYPDGYVSWSPPEAFEKGYTEIVPEAGKEALKVEPLGFEAAIAWLKQTPKGQIRRVARQGWNGKGQWIAMQTPDENSLMGLPYLYISTVDGHKVPWLASQTDLLAEDWVIVE